MWDYPTFVEIDGVRRTIRNNCDYRMVLDCISALNDVDLTEEERVKCALFIFYPEFDEIVDLQTAITEMYLIINGGEKDTSNTQAPRLVDWEHDFPRIVAPVNRVLGYEVRTPGKYTHWYTFLSGYMEIGDCTFSQIVSIRAKRAKGQKLSSSETEYLRNHREQVLLPQKISAKDQEILNSPW